MSKDASKSKKSGFSVFGLLFKGSILALIAAIVFRTDDVLFTITFLLSAHTSWNYLESPYWNYVKAKWEKMPVVDPVPIPEIDIKDFTREKLLELSNGLADPVVIRGAIKDSVAVKKWTREYFRENYANETVVVREMLGDVIRFQHRSFADFYLMESKGRNVSIVASSSIFYRNKQFKEELMSPVEKDLVGPKGEPIIAQQFFITPGGRSWYHCAVGNNVFRQIQGQKRWNVIDPKKYNMFMCPSPVITATSVTPW
jgi:hypothetical protein